MAYTNKITWENLRSLDAATLTGGHDPIGDPLEHPSYICKLVNNSDTLVTISIDGANDIDVAPANSFWLYDEDAGNNNEPAIPARTQFYLKGTAGTGNIYLVTQYRIQR